MLAPQAAFTFGKREEQQAVGVLGCDGECESARQRGGGACEREEATSYGGNSVLLQERSKLQQALGVVDCIVYAAERQRERERENACVGGWGRGTHSQGSKPASYLY